MTRDYKSIASLCILLFINFIFAYKYLSRYFEFALIISVGILILQAIAFWHGHKFKLSKELKVVAGVVFFSLLLGLILISHIKIPLEILKVDRWSVISSFITELFNGEYPYFAKSHRGNPPGPMPFYFLIALPFYLLGELSALSSLGYALFIFIAIKKASNSTITFFLFYLALSLFMVWEITVRSNLFTFTMIVTIILYFYTQMDKSSDLRFVVLSVLTGLFLSTRSVYVLPYIIFFVSSLINREHSFGELFKFLGIALISFISTFIPLLIFYGDDFYVMNPFIIQSTFFLPTWYTFLFISMAIIIAFIPKTRADKFFYSGLCLFISIFIYGTYYMVNYGYQISYIEGKMDISYFIFAIPFLLFYILKDSRKQNIIKNSNEDTGIAKIID